MLNGIIGSGNSLRNSFNKAAADGTSPSVSRGASPERSKEALNFSTERAFPLMRKRPS